LQADPVAGTVPAALVPAGWVGPDRPSESTEPEGWLQALQDDPVAGTVPAALVPAVRVGPGSPSESTKPEGWSQALQDDPVAGTVPAALVPAVCAWDWIVRQNRQNLKIGYRRYKATRRQRSTGECHSI